MKKSIFILLALVAISSVLFAQEPYSVRMIRSEMQRNPDATYLDGRNGERKWNYTTGLELKAFLDASKRYELPEVIQYVRDWADTMATEKGVVYKYKKTAFNVDHICPARIYFDLHDMYGDEDKRYRRVTRMIREQIDDQPRTASGEFWHKQIYPHQVWLDGFYMALPFYAEYTKRYAPVSQKDSLFADIVHQFTAGAENTLDPATGLFRHAWDESKSMFWCDPQTGLSAHAWGRANGWYAVALVEVLDYLPEKHPGRQILIDQLNYFLKVLPDWADPQTGMWYQVLDCPGREGNYLEATCSIMFTYAFLKGLRMGYIDDSYRDYVLSLYPKFINRFIKENEDGTISMTDCCSVGGLGGKQMRKGDFDYYLSEPIIDNDCKGVGPFIWASLEWEAMHNIDYYPSSEGHELAFAGAEGCGKFAEGGRGGKEYVVTSLLDDGTEGTLRHAVELEGPRVIRFAVSGDIRLKSPLNIENPFISILGETAPGEGITIRDHNVFITADHTVIRYLRFRLGSVSGAEADALGAKRCSNIIIDHCSISWATDENASFYNINDATIQWCIISEALNASVHHKGEHGYGGIWGGRNVTFHHNLFAHNKSRNPRFDHPRIYSGQELLTGRGTVDFVNNVVYNWNIKAIYGGEEGWFNVVNNYFRPGPATKQPDGEWLDISTSETTSMIPGNFHIQGNAYDVSAVKKGALDGMRPSEEKIAAWESFYKEKSTERPYAIKVGMKADDASVAYKAVLKHAGASERRDAVDRRIIREVRKGKAANKGSVTGLPGIIDSVNDVVND
ncbi:MAG: glycoside hydrolase family 88 protein [Bacteroidales bacterium]|nr:glycoside hydrolase family 88 protein [Bacteroidales bacterium]MBQ8810968.1 glycoside hydrolase family 88 protein [Bacteroidales bacterium]